MQFEIREGFNAFVYLYFYIFIYKCNKMYLCIKMIET